MVRLILITVCVSMSMTACSDVNPLATAHENTSLLDKSTSRPDVAPVESQPAVVTKPFTGSWQTNPGPPDPITGEFGIIGSGIATHLGRNTFTAVSTVNAGIQVGSTVLTAANGDELSFDFAGTGSPPDAQGNVFFSGIFHFTGGTGRFSNASGTGTYAGTANVFAGVGEVSQSGTLVIPH